MALNFDKLSSKAGLTQLNTYLASRVYVFGLEPTAQDATLFGLIGSAPDAAAYPNVARYYAHIESFGADKSKFVALEGLTVSDTPVAPAAGGKKDDDSEDEGLGGLLDSDDDSDDDEDPAAVAAAMKAKAEAAAKAKKKGKKRRAPERSEIILDVKPFDDQTDLEALAAKIKALTLVTLKDEEYPGPNEDGETWADLEKQAQEVDERITLETGHHWGQNHQLEEIGYGIKKLRVQCIVQNELVGSDLLIELIMAKFADDVQSVDVAAFQKV